MRPVPHDEVMHGDDLKRVRGQLDAEKRFMDERGQRWAKTYIQPFYLRWMGEVAQHDVLPLIPAVRGRAFELSVGEINAMLRMHWRIQVMGTWFAIARNDRACTTPVHEAFEACSGGLTSPGLAVAVLTYPDETTPHVLRAYRERSIAHDYGDCAIINAALSRLDPRFADPDETRDDEALGQMLDVAELLRGPA